MHVTKRNSKWINQLRIKQNKDNTYTSLIILLQYVLNNDEYNNFLTKWTEWEEAEEKGREKQSP